MHCLVGSLLWQEILGDHFFVQNMFVSKNLNTLSGKKMLVSLSQRNQTAY